MFPKQAFILAGGKGERLWPITENIPKPMVKVQGKPILQYSVENLAGFGVKKIILGVSYKAEKVKEHFMDGKDFGVEIIYSLEDGFLGTGGALKNAEELIGGKFVMQNGDTLMDVDLRKMNEFHEEKKATGTIAVVQVSNVSNYGVARLESEKIVEFVEKPEIEQAPSNLVNTGTYILEKKAIELIPKEFNLIEKTLFPTLAKNGNLYGFRHEGKWFPVDDVQKLKITEHEWK